MEKNMFSKPEIMKQISARLQEIGFNMDEWVVNTYSYCPENHAYYINGEYYDSYDYIYVVNKVNRREVFNLWLDLAWTDGMKLPILFIDDMIVCSTVSPIDDLDGDVEQHFDKTYFAIEDTERFTAELVEKYSLKPVPDYKSVIQRFVTADQYDAIMEQSHFKTHEE